MFLHIFLISCLFATFSAEERCTYPNTQYNACASSCEETCDGRPDGCAGVCIPKCECIPGFVVHQNECVPKEYCDKLKCRELNMEYTKCGTYCPKTCDEPEETFCIEACFEGCQCKDGYVLHDLKCIKLEECPQK